MSKMDSVQKLIATGEWWWVEKNILVISKNFIVKREKRATIRQKEKEESEHQLKMERLYYEMIMEELEEEHDIEMTRENC